MDRTRVFVHLVEPLPDRRQRPAAELPHRPPRAGAATAPALAAKPEVVAVSKCELTGSDEVRDRLEQELGREVLAISAVTGQGLAKLVSTIALALELDKDNAA